MGFPKQVGLHGGCWHSLHKHSPIKRINELTSAMGGCMLHIFFRSPRATMPNSFKFSLLSSRYTAPSILLVQNFSMTSSSNPLSLSNEHTSEIVSKSNGFVILPIFKVSTVSLWANLLSRESLCNIFSYGKLDYLSPGMATTLRTNGYMCPYFPKKYITSMEVLRAHESHASSMECRDDHTTFIPRREDINLYMHSAKWLLKMSETRYLTRAALVGHTHTLSLPVYPIPSWKVSTNLTKGQWVTYLQALNFDKVGEPPERMGHRQ